MKWFKAQANGDGTANVTIDKIIASDWSPDWVVDFFGEKSARDFIDAVDALGDLTEINLKLNTPGGDVFSGIRIANYLINHKAKVHVTVEAMAASIGSVIMLAGDTRTMLLGSRVMAHKPSAGLDGWFTAEDLRNHADRVDEIENAIIELYVARTGQTEESIRDMLSQGDYYMDADKAIALGFATDKSEQLKAAACMDQAMFEMQGKVRAAETQILAEQGKIAALKDQIKEQGSSIESLTAELEAFRNPAAAPADDVITKCAEAGFADLAVPMAQAKLPMATIEQRLKLAGEIKDLAKAQSIDATGMMAHLGSPVDLLRHAIQEAKASVDPNINSNHHQNRSENHAGSWSAAFSKTTK
ncbi:head maturation protease, ClpP-related [Marinobacterium litorale]|uniref:head maturation protease, ClpP-related n=1 Tax=Marinobacterium litorale TaxID=404770 RepID=UPI0004203BF5|nr:head maturation protease, ClpP-related [Marinobacterium litorale]